MVKRRIIFVLVVCSLIAVFAARARSSDLFSPADSPKVRWESMTYEKKLYNPAIPQKNRGLGASESLSLSCDVQMSDPSLLVGMARDATIERIIDGQGNDVGIGQDRSQSGSWFTDNKIIRKPKLELNTRSLDQAGGEIKLLKGYYTGLMAESIEYVDVPFRPSESWIRVTPDLEIRVVKASNVPSMHHYEIEHRPEIMIFQYGYSVGDNIPSRLVLAEQIIAQNNSGVGGYGRGVGSTGTPGVSISKGSGTGRAERIRYVIAVNATQEKIPFEFQNIPLSAPTEPTPFHVHGSKRTSNLPVIEHLRNKGLAAKKYEADKTSYRTRPTSNVKDGNLYDVDWHSIIYRFKFYNPAISKREPDRRLSVHCEAKILNPELVLATCNEPIIERITDGSGRDIDISRSQPRLDRMSYRTPRYRTDPINRTQPSTIVQLEGKARRALGLPLKFRHIPKPNSILMPVTMTIDLDPGLIEQGRKEIRQIEGYFHALTAESYKHIKVPFNASDKWVRLTSDVEIQVAKAWHDGFKHRYDIRERPPAQIRKDLPYIDQPLPDGIVVDRQFVATGALPKSSFSKKWGRSLPVSASGRGSVGRSVNNIDCPIEKIDYRIAVGPAHKRIPITLEHIPLPKP